MSAWQENEAKTGLKLIEVNKILPHPDNPRKDLGDLTELCGSIRSNGILQNLTVVPYQDGQGLYRCVIGHRRLAAARMAGLILVPCTVADMTDNAQRVTMLTENMQRADLTLIEQADAFQTMLDLGDSVASLADKTGLSQTTVRRRVKLAALDRELLLQAEARGGTMKDYLALEEIADPELKNKVLAEIGTNNFAIELRDALLTEKVKARQAVWRPVLLAFAEEINEVDWKKLRYSARLEYSDDPESYVAPAESRTGEHFFSLSRYGISLYVLCSAQEDKEAERRAERDRLEEERLARVARLKALTEHAANLRAAFVRDYPVMTLRENAFLRRLVMGQLLENLLLQDDWLNPDAALFASMMGLQVEEDADLAEHLVQPALDQPLEQALLALALATSPVEERGYYNKFDGSHSENPELDRDYQLLIRLGYLMSDVEKQLKDGTHPLLLRKEEGAA